MSNLPERLLLVTITAALVLAVGGAAFGEITLSSDPSRATANSVWNLMAVWTHAEGAWPVGMSFNWSSGPGSTPINYNPTKGTVRLMIPPEDVQEGQPEEPPDEWRFYPVLARPTYVGFDSADVSAPHDWETFQPEGWVSIQPDPEPLRLEDSGDPRYDHGLDFVAEEMDVDDGGPGISTVENPADAQVVRNPDGSLQQVFIPREEDGGVLVPMHEPLWLEGVWLDELHTRSVKARLTNAAELFEGDEEAGLPQWPMVNVIVFPDGLPAGVERLYVSYYHAGTQFVATQQAPLPMPYTVYRVDPDPRASARGITRIRVNPHVMNLANLDLSDPDISPDYALIGVFDNPELEGDNFALQYIPPGARNPYTGIVMLDPELTGAAGLPRETTLYLAVRSFAVEGVYDNANRTGTNYFWPDKENGGERGVYDAKQGIIRLVEPLATAGRAVYVDYRPLSRRDFTVLRPVPVQPTALEVLPDVEDYEPDLTTIGLAPGKQGTFRIIDEDNLLPIGTIAVGVSYAWADPETSTTGQIWVTGLGGEAVPLYYVEGNPISGAIYRGAVSAGLNMSNVTQQPHADRDLNAADVTNTLIFDPRLRPMYYAPNLHAEGDGTPRGVLIDAFAYCVVDGAVEFHEFKDLPLTIHDSRPQGITPDFKPEMINYGGVNWDRDSLTCYPDQHGGSWPYGFDVDPLTIEPIEELNPADPDAGSSTTEYVFRVRYRHRDGTNLMPPKPWLPGQADPWGSAGPTGVVLYLDYTGTGDYRPHFMYLENPWAASGDTDYDVWTYRINPKHTLGTSGEPHAYPWQRLGFATGIPFDNRTYQSLQMGTYHYFFGCSDDSLTFDGGSLVFANQLFPEEYGHAPSWNTRGSTGLDPTLPRAVTNYSAIDRSAHRKYTADGVTDFDYTIHVDRPIRVAGLFDTGAAAYKYKWDGDHHPQVTCELRMPVLDGKGLRFDDVSYGTGRFFGTVANYYRASNPVHRGNHTGGDAGALAETHGVKSNAENTFRILYKSLNNDPPTYIRIYINNASEKSGTTPEHQYTSYTMYERPDQVFPDPANKYRDGVWYEYKTKLPPGPHTYYFQAYDGEHIARFPARLDSFDYATVDFADNRAIVNSGRFFDWWVPTGNSVKERQAEGYFDNDYFPGPYVNNPSVLSDASVTPGTGKQGTRFRYRVKYSDPDGQRVFSAFITIEINDKGDTRTYRMIPETNIFLPDNGSDAAYQAIMQQYRDGVYYYFDTASVDNLALGKGSRRYYFTFIDDWGRLHDINDTVKGQETRLPAGGGNWMPGPVVSGNVAPTLSSGSVQSQDGTANAATLWTWRVNYRDLNGDKPTLIKLYIGELQSDGETILWDDGHTMAESTPNDQVYTDGKAYYFQTRLGAIDAVIPGEPAPAPKQYYYAFVAYDGYNWATYRSSTNEELRSDAAGCVVNLPADRIASPNPEHSYFKFNPLVAQQATVNGTSSVTPDNPGDIVRIVGVYQTADLTGTNHYTDPGTGDPYPGGAIALSTALPAGKTKAWVHYEPRAPIIGPLPIDLPAPAGVIPDAQIFENNGSIPLRIEDQKNGWIPSADDTDRDRAVLWMKGLAIYEGQPSPIYVAPDFPERIASVEGVYLTPDFSDTNYYDPELVDPPVIITATVNPDDETRSTVIPSHPGRIVAVRGVYENDQLEGTNYYTGDGNLSWQEAYVVGAGSVWPTDPLNIVSVEGVHLGMQQTLRNYSNPDRLSVQDGFPFDSEEDPIRTVTVGDVDAIQEVLGVYTEVSADGEPTGTNYYDPSVAVHTPGNEDIPLAVDMPVDTENIYVHYINAGFGYGPYGEYLALTRTAPRGTTKMYVAHHAPGGLDRDGNIVLGVPLPEGVDNVFVQIDTQGFKAGDKLIRLTSELPETLHGAAPANRTVYVQYSDIRFTHRLRGEASQPVVTPFGVAWYPGATHYSPDGWSDGLSFIKGNAPMHENDLDAITGGMIGIWTNEQRDGVNFFNPYLSTRFDDGSFHVRLTQRLPEGVDYLWAHYYQTGAYRLDRWNRRVVFLEPKSDETPITGSFFFGTKMPMTLGANTPCELYDGGVTPLQGSRSTQYVYKVTYRDLDGPNGQAPAFVRVYIDEQPFDMTPQGTGGTPAYREGAVFVYTPPNGLAGGSHKYRFEASDGVSAAWFDANGAHQGISGASITDVKDLDGPYVNNPPDLSSGAANPNPTNGTIGTNQSIDYTVTYKDVDGNEPFFFDPLSDLDDVGQPIGDSVKVSGSPRLWVDSGSIDTAYTGKVRSVAPDPLEPSKNRTIVAEDNPGWSPDQFAGKLMQITDGPLQWRVYLIQSNTAGSLIVATDDLLRDGITPGVGFRINGMLMQKADENAVDYANGIQYKITVPKLGAGTHRFHFTARSRELKPQWLADMLRATGALVVPYSAEVRLPVAGDYNGPNVARSIPTGNSAPVLDNTELTALWRGPKVQAASVDTESRVIPVDFLKIRSVQGVYMNANLTGASYYNSATTANPFTPGDTDIKLSPSLGALSGASEVVRIAAPAPADGMGSDLNVVVPDAAASIGSVLGVYLNSDTALSGTNYYDPATANPAFAPGDTQIRLTTPLPSGVTTVYVKCTPAVKSQNGGVSSTTTVIPTNLTAVAGVLGVYDGSDTNMTGTNYYDPATASPAYKPGDGSITLTTPLGAGVTSVKIKYVSWPPAYVKYFGFADTDAVYLAGEPLTFWIQYRDPDNDPPTYHDSVQGYVRVVFNDSGRGTQLQPENPPVTDYTKFVPFSVTLTDVPEGTHKYHFEGSDGYYDVFWPVGTTTNPRSKDYTIKVNYKPVLRSGTVDHTSGATTFTFSTIYQDRDNVAPQVVTITLKKVDNPTVVVRREMHLDPGETNPNYASGARYVATFDAKDPNQPLAPGRYNVVFEANDGYQDATPLAGPDIVIRDTNVPPVIVDYWVNPQAGKTSETFVFTAFYHDEENDVPVAIHNGQRVTGLTLILDKGSSTEQRLLMTRVTEDDGPGTPPPGGVPPPPTPPDYSIDEGVEFSASLSGKRLGPGKHTYTVEANDGTDVSVFASGVPVFKNGPILKVPYFDLRVVGRDGSSITDRAVVGTDVLIVGNMLFPYTGSAPRNLSDVTIRVTKPDQNVIALNASLTNIRPDELSPHANWVGDITATYSGFVDPALTTGDSLTLTASGQWTFGAIWPGDSEWDRAETDTNMDGQNDVVRVTVSGPARTVAVEVPELPDTSAPVVDMITPPMVIGSPYPDAIFGANRALEMQIVRWSPTAATYFRYGVGGPFPDLKPGDAIWIKPRQYDPATHLGYPAAEPLGLKAALRAYVTGPDTINIPPTTDGKTDYVAYVSGVYLNSALTGLNYYDPNAASAVANPFRQGDSSFKLTSGLPAGTEVWVDYVIYPLSGVDEGWIALDNPAVAKAMDGGEPRYYHSKYRLIKSLAQAYPTKSDTFGNPILDLDTKLPVLKPSLISLKRGWNQFGNIFFNWKRGSQQALPIALQGGGFDLTKVQPTNPGALQGKVLGVYMNAQMTGENFYQPGMAKQPYKPGTGYIPLTKSLPAGQVNASTRFYVKYEAYPREDVGIPIREVYVNYLGQRKTLSEAAAAGWINDYAWRYDAAERGYVHVHASASGAERVLRAWSGYWIRAMVECTLEIDPNTSYSGGDSSGLSAGLSRENPLSAPTRFDMPPPIPE